MKDTKKKTNIFILKDSYERDYDYIFILNKEISKQEIEEIIIKSREKYYEQEFEMSLMEYIFVELNKREITYNYHNIKDFEYTFDY